MTHLSKSRSGLCSREALEPRRSFRISAVVGTEAQPAALGDTFVHRSCAQTGAGAVGTIFPRSWTLINISENE